VDVPRLRESLGRSAPFVITNEDAGEWLINRGFHVGLGGWDATQGVIDQLSAHLIVSRNRLSSGVPHPAREQGVPAGA